MKTKTIAIVLISTAVVGVCFALLNPNLTAKSERLQSERYERAARERIEKAIAADTWCTGMSVADLRRISWVGADLHGPQLSSDGVGGKFEVWSITTYRFYFVDDRLVRWEHIDF